uniref:Uncharacterized protein n=1 Tax=Eptatretus burgeri TaxID=7764 RepID=A0A8C4Q1S1_EPTBU
MPRSRWLAPTRTANSFPGPFLYLAHPLVSASLHFVLTVQHPTRARMSLVRPTDTLKVPVRTFPCLVAMTLGPACQCHRTPECCTTPAIRISSQYLWSMAGGSMSPVPQAMPTGLPMPFFRGNSSPYPGGHSSTLHGASPSSYDTGGHGGDTVPVDSPYDPTAHLLTTWAPLTPPDI